MEISAHDNLDIPNTERDTQSNPHKHTLYKPQMLPCALKTPLTSSIDGLAYIFPLRNISHTLMFNCTTRLFTPQHNSQRQISLISPGA